MWAFWAFLVPKVHWGLKNIWKKFPEFAKKIADLRSTLCGLLFQICFRRPKRFAIPSLDGSPQQIYHVKLYHFQFGQRFKKLVLAKIYTIGNRDTYNVNEYPNKYFSKQYITHESVFFFFSFMTWVGKYTFLIVP